MRTSELKIGNEKKESILVAGGKGFKIYTTSGYDGWILAVGRKIHLIDENSHEFKTVARYVNLRYQPISEQTLVKELFNELIEAKTSDIDQ